MVAAVLMRPTSNPQFDLAYIGDLGLSGDACDQPMVRRNTARSWSRPATRTGRVNGFSGPGQQQGGIHAWSPDPVMSWASRVSPALVLVGPWLMSFVGTIWTMLPAPTKNDPASGPAL